MRYFVDTEFIERGYEKIELISVGIAAEDGREFYAVASDGWEPGHASEWVRTNVLPHLGPESEWIPRAEIVSRMKAFVGEKPELWGYFSDYDWVLICQLFGTMMDLPETWPRFCRDVKQLHVDLGSPLLPPQTGTAHNALDDARHIKEMHTALMKLKATRR